MYKCGLFALLFALSSIGLSIGFSGSAGAASAYDDVYRELDQLFVSYPGTCEPLNITQDIFSRFLDSEDISEELKNSYRIALNGDGRWSVSNEYSLIPRPNEIPDMPNASENYTQAIMWWTEDDSLEMSWRNGGVYMQGNNVRGIQVYINENDCENVNVIDASSYVTGIPIAGGAGGGSNTTIYMYPLFAYINEENRNLPEGYAGHIPRDVLPGGNDDITPDIDYEVVGKTIKFKYNDKNVPFTPCSLNWMVTKTNYETDDFADNTFFGRLEDAWQGLHDLTGAKAVSDQNDEVLEFLYKKQITQEQTYTVPDHGNYLIALGLNSEWPGAPYKSCGDNGIPSSFGYTHRIKVVALKIDGSLYSGTTDGAQCAASGGFCSINKDANKNPMLDVFKSLDNIEIHGLQAFFLAPINFYGQLPSLSQNCTPITVPLMDSSFQLECLSQRYWSWSYTVMSVFTVTINAIVAYIVASRIFETIKNINSPDKDRIEVAKL